MLPRFLIAKSLFATGALPRVSSIARPVLCSRCANGSFGTTSQRFRKYGSPWSVPGAGRWQGANVARGVWRVLGVGSDFDLIYCPARVGPAVGTHDGSHRILRARAVTRRRRLLLRDNK